MTEFMNKMVCSIRIHNMAFVEYKFRNMRFFESSIVHGKDVCGVNSYS
jgi:hypothetical protein